ncbi:hypothetical protein [Streptomyces sp. NPDC051452]|uniref:hypothetical protein n=1 Tax=Streptomyces sp. NPDC051452 TaxID=3365654 RepID=UPI00378AAFA3
MTAIRARSRTERGDGPRETGPSATGVARGRHRKPRPHKVLLVVGGLALAAGALSLVRVAPESGAGAPGTAEAEPRLDPGGGAPDRPAAGATTADPTALPSATSAMGGRSPAPTATGIPNPSASGDATPGAPDNAPGTTATPADDTAVPTSVPTGAPSTAGGVPPRPSATTAAPRPAPTTRAPAPGPTPGHGTPDPDPDPGEVCLPVIGLCVGLSDGPGR